jgi:long-chain acyl-CoA synthetase
MANKSLTIPSFLNHSIKENGEVLSLGFAGEKPITYSEMGNSIESLIALLEKNDIRPGDKIALLSSNMPNWGISYFAITSMGAVVVPILPDFTIEEIANVLEHSEAVGIFISSSLTSKISGLRSDNIRLIITTDDFFVVKGKEGVIYETGTSPEKNYDVREDDIAALIYTSGTTGKSKGVMLTHKNLCFTVEGSRKIQSIFTGDVFLSILPLSHTYEQTLGLLLGTFNGATTYYLRKAPTPSVLLPALQEIRPTIMLTVPLIMEKIYFGKIVPKFQSSKVITLLYGIAPIRKMLNRAAGKKLYKTFGGRLKFFGIGGAKVNPVVEKFLIEARFPYAIGYGLTETAPLLAGTVVGKTSLGSTGPAMPGVTLKINAKNPATGEGEIWAKGDNLMKGYFKEPKMTAEVITPDGWFRTGDLGLITKEGYLHIKGRLKNMIVGSSGENIYPEEIESVINDLPPVIESLVVQKKGKLVAMVHLNLDELEEKYNQLKKEYSEKAEEMIDEYLEEIRCYVNSKVNKFSQIQVVVYQPVPFQKTATLKIKRFLYY